jgi:hypothetical protein
VSDEVERPELEAVSRLLAQARHDEPMPDDVAARMDGVLAELKRERARAPEDAPVISLEGHRRRRAAALLVAAAAIVVGGVTAAQHLPLGSGSHPTAGSSEDGRTTAGGQPPGSQSPPTSPLPGPQLATQVSKPRIQAGRVLVRPGHFAADALSARQAAGPSPSAPFGEGTLRSVPPGCVTGLGDAEVVPATYELAPAALVYHAPTGTTQVVDLYVCGAPKPVRSITLPTP